MKLGNNTIWNKRLPSIFGFLFLLLAFGTISWLSRNTILTGTKAATGNVPKDVKISNITDSTFTVSYVTDSNVLGSISYGTLGKMDQVALDDRDAPQAASKEHTIHYITVENLAPSTAYSFTITSGDEKFINKEAAYQVTTGAALTSASSDKTEVSGKIRDENGTPVTEAIVYISTTNSQLISTVVDSSGNYKFAIQNLRKNDLSSFMDLAPDSKLLLQVVNATKQSKVSVLKNQTNPVPMIILSKDYDFAVSSEPIETPVATDSAELTGTPAAFPTIQEGGSSSTAPKILTPQEDQEFQDDQPLFKGKAEPNETVTITINSEQTISATVKADANGNWQYRPDEPLEPGPHTITIKTVDSSGLMRIITQSFVVYAEGSQFTEPSVSPSTSVTSSPTQSAPTTQPTTAATATPTATNTPAPSQTTVSPSANPTATKTPAPTNGTSISTSPTTPPIPVTGNTSLVMTTLGIFATIGIGALLLVFTAL